MTLAYISDGWAEVVVVLVFAVLILGAMNIDLRKELKRRR
jgi:Sec-independent protein translocase protein TatA